MERLSRITESLLPYGQRQIHDVARGTEILSGGRQYEAAARVDYVASGRLTNEQLKRSSIEAALEELRQSGRLEEVGQGGVIKLAKLKYATAKAQRFVTSQVGVTALRKAAEKGAYLTTEAAELPEEQKAAIREQRLYRLNTRQIHSQMMADGSIPDQFLPAFGSTGPDNILISDRVPQNLKDIFKSRLETEHFGPPSMRETMSESKSSVGDFLKSLGIFPVDIISTGSRFINGAAAGYIKALQDSQLAGELRKRGGKQFLGIPSQMFPITNIPYTPIPAPKMDWINTIAEDPSMAGRILMAQASAAIDGAVSGAKGAVEPWIEIGNREELGHILAETGVHYKQEALQLAFNNRRPDEPKEEVLARAKNIYNNLIENDSGELAIKHPMAATLIVEILGDPLNYIPLTAAGKVIKGAWGLSKAVPVAGQLPKILGWAGTRVLESNTAQSAKRAFVAGPWATKNFSVMGEAALKKLPKGARGEIKRAMLASQDVGRAAAMRVSGIGARIDEQLSRLKDVEVGDAFDLMEMYRGGSGRAEVGLEIAKRIQDPKRREAVTGILDEVNRLSNDLYKESAARGQLNDIRRIVDPATGKPTGHAVVRATYLEGYVPHRVFEGVGDLTEKLNRAGFPDIESSMTAIALNKAKKAKEALDAAPAAPAASKAALKTEIARLTEMLEASGGAKGNINMLMEDEYLGVRALLYRIGHAKAAGPDIIGQTSIHRIKSVTTAAKERKGFPGVVKDMRVQWAAHIKRERAAAERAGEIDELVRWAGKSQTMKSLTNGEPFKILNLGHKVTGKDLDDAARHIATLSDELGVELGTLDLELGRRFLQATGAAVDPYKTVVVMPKMMAGRINEVLPRMVSTTAATTAVSNSVEQGMNVLKGFNDYIIKPVNAWWRPTKTVTRSLAFHATNIGGAVGLGVLAHGMRAFNPALQGGAARVAINAALTGTGSGKLANKMFKLGSGEKISLGHLQDIMAKYGILGQSGLRYGAQIPGGKGPIQFLANVAQKVAVKTRAQQVAAFGDDYQHAVAFLGWMKRNGKLRGGKIDTSDIHRAVDFTAEYSGNYGRLTAFEKTAMRDIFAFYSWNRFILPHIAKQIVKHPGRLAGFEKFQRGVQTYIYETGGGRPIPASGLPDFIQLSGGIAAPEMWQPDVEPGKPGSHELGVMVMETPMASLTSLAPGFGGQSPITAQYGPVGLGFAMALNGFEPSETARGRAYGSKMWLGLPTIDDIAHKFNSPEDYMTALGNVADSRIGGEALGMIPFGEALSSLSELYIREGMYDEATELHLKYRVGRDWLGLDRLAAKALGFKPLSIGSFIPGAKIYAVDPYQVAARRKSRALAILPKNIID